MVSRRVVEQTHHSAVIQLGEGIRASCPILVSPAAVESNIGGGVDLSSLTSMLSARWKGASTPSARQPEPLGMGQIRSFRIAKLDREAETIELELA